MAKLRRTAYAFFYAYDGTFVDIPALLRGEVELAPLRQVLGISILTGREHIVSPEHLRLLLDLPSGRWISDEELSAGDREAARSLAQSGLVLSDEADEGLVELRRRDERLGEDGWNLYAALYHFMTQWRDVDVERAGQRAAELIQELPEASKPDLEAFFERYGRPPHHFYAFPDPVRSRHLELPERDGPLYELLKARKTTRSFNSSTPVSEAQLSAVLYYAFGCHGLATVSPELAAVKKTSPSGGALHPIEVYPLVVNVSGIEPGLYHYNIADHSLELAVAAETAEAASWAREFTAGQSYFGSAHVLFVLSARFRRNYWKYRQHQRAYAVLLMDAAHLSQTLYLVCTELGLGAFVTAAVNGRNIEERLGLDPVAEGAIAVLGCGVPDRGPSELEPEFEPYLPPR